MTRTTKEQFIDFAGDEPEELPHGLIVSEYVFEDGYAGMKVARCPQRNGPAKWAVRRNGDVLGKSGEWDWEPQPSSRTDEWLAEFRFDTAIDAIKAAVKAAERLGVQP